MKICIEDECGRITVARGMCKKHYNKWNRDRNRTQPFQRRTARHHARHSDYLIRDSMGRKQCSACKEWKSESDYLSHPKNKDGLFGHCNPCRKLSSRATKYKKSVDDILRMIDQQNGLCQICSKPLGEDYAIDHDHDCCNYGRQATKKSCGSCVRGLLCKPCNLALGIFKDDLEILVSAAFYLYSSKK